MTQESINDLVRSAANKLSKIWGDDITETVSSVAMRTNLLTGERIPSPTRKLSKPITYSQCFTELHTPILQRIFIEEILPFTNLDIAELPLIGARNAKEYYLSEADKNRLRVLEIRYELHTKLNDELDIEQLEEEIRCSHINQIQAQLYADFYSQVVEELSKEKPTASQFYFIDYFITNRSKFLNQENKKGFYEYMSNKYGEMPENYKKAFTRVCGIIEEKEKITSGQKKPLSEDLTKVREYFHQHGQHDKIKQVIIFARERGIDLS